MKKIQTLLALMITPILVSAQNNNGADIDKEIFRICATIFVLVLVMVFILLILKHILEHRIKNTIVEKGIPESMVSSILGTKPKEDQNINIKWFSILAGIGAALTIIYFTPPLGIHSLAIMAFCIAASFLGYYYFLKQSEK